MCRNNHDRRGNCLCNGEEAFQRLILEVEEIDPKAAEYLRSEDCREVMRMSANTGLSLGYACGHLDDLFLWRLTPQGHEYWDALDDRLKEARA